MGTKFSIGSGSSLPKARILPEGTPVEIVSASNSGSQFKRTIQKGPKAGEEADVHQLFVVVSPLTEGTTEDPLGEFEEQDFAPGDQFVQYYGGVYPKDQGGYTYTPTGGAAIFLTALLEKGCIAEIGDEIEDIVGTQFVIEYESGRTPKKWTRIMPAGPVGDGDVTPSNKAKGARKALPAPAKKAAPVRGKAKAPVDDEEEDEEPEAQSAFDALSEEDQEAVNEQIADGVRRDDLVEALVEAGIAVDDEDALSIIDSAPKPEKTIAKKSPAKAAAKGGKAKRGAR